jgi:multidrug efflux pump subunit AcrA (membrane-fusion protein)
VDPRTYQANLDEAQANQEANLANLAFLEKQVKRITSLKESDYVGEESLDDATSRLAQTQAAIARQAAIIESRRLDLERTTIRAPFSGRVYEESVDVGDIVSPGMELASFYASDEVEIVVSLNANDAAFIPGLWNTDSNVSGKRKAWVTVDHGGRNYQWQGYVHRVESDIDRTTRTVDVVVRVPDPFTPGTPASDRHSPVPMEPPPLLVGMYAGVDIEGMRIDRHFELPISALRSDNTIWTVSGEGILNVVPVDVIREEGNQVALLAGDLPEGTPIIVSDIALVTDGMRVNVGQSPATEGAIL